MIDVAPRRPIDLSHGTRDELSDTLRVSLSTELDADEDSGGCPPGAQDYYAEFTVTWYPEHGLHVTKDAESTLRRLAEASGSDLTGDAVQLPVGHGHFLVVDTFSPDVYDALDAREGDLEKLASSLFPGESDDRSLLAPDLDDVVEFVGGFAILVNSVTIDPLWRGASFGLRATGTVLEELRRGCSFAALHPMTPGTKGVAARDSSHRALSRYWGRLGFRPWRDEIMVLPLATTALDTARSQLRS
jgi:hypothetical protein